MYKDMKKDITELASKEGIDACIAYCFDESNDNAASDFDRLLECWSPDEVIGRLARLRFKDCAAVVRQIRQSASLKYDGRPVKTIATYYHRLNNGGTERVLCQLCKIWVKMGYKVIVITEEQPSDEDYELPEGITRLVIPPFLTLPKNYQVRAEALRRIIQDYHVDTFVFHGWWVPCALWDVLTIKASGASCIVVYHNVFSYWMLNDDKNLTNIGDSMAFLTIADAIVTLSKSDQAFWSCFNNNVHECINPFSEDLAGWVPAPYSANHSILWLARLDSKQKSPMDIIPIMKEVLCDVPDAVLHVVGKSNDGYLEMKMKKAVSRQHLEEHIVFEGFHTDVKPWYRDCQIFLMTSSFEGYPLTLQECKMAGRPCVLYEMPYLTLCEGNRGLIPVPQRDTRAAARALVSLLTDDALCDRMGRDARAHIEELAGVDLEGKWRQIFQSVEQVHQSAVPEAERMMMETLIAHYMQSLQDAKSVTIRKIVRKLVPDRLKPAFEAFLPRIPSGVRIVIKRLLHWS